MTAERITWAEATEKLFHACRTNSVAEAKAAIHAHANLFEQDADGNMPLHVAAMHNSDEVLHLLVSPSVGFDINTPNAENLTALHLASHRNALKAVKAIANHPQTDFSIAYDRPAHGPQKHTVAYDAAFDGHMEVVHIIDAAMLARQKTSAQREKQLAERVEVLETQLAVAMSLRKHRGGDGPGRS